MHMCTKEMPDEKEKEQLPVSRLSDKVRTRRPFQPTIVEGKELMLFTSKCSFKRKKSGCNILVCHKIGLIFYRHLILTRLPPLIESSVQQEVIAGHSKNCVIGQLSPKRANSVMPAYLWSIVRGSFEKR